ncbi:MAG: hypothetical protein P1V97_07655 [Planctomycetota bacterium]|nr:hypothetical protein [Planctomycetota bacterium]
MSPAENTDPEGNEEKLEFEVPKSLDLGTPDSPGFPPDDLFVNTNRPVDHLPPPPPPPAPPPPRINTNGPPEPPPPAPLRINTNVPQRKPSLEELPHPSPKSRPLRINTNRPPEIFKAPAPKNPDPSDESE